MATTARPDIPPRPVVITGAAGYLGSRLTRALVSAGADVTAVVRRRVPYLTGCRQVEVDLAQPSTELAASLTAAGSVVHLAGANEVAARAAPERSLSEAVAGAWRVADSAVLAGVPRLVYVSTAHVYGAAVRPGAVVTEELLPAPVSPYSIARLACEHICFERAGQPGSVTSAVCFRVTNAVGAPEDPGVDRWSLVANDLCRQAAVEGHLRLHTNGLQWRDFVHIDDVCDILAAALGPLRLPGGLYNLASGRPLRVRDLAETVQAGYTELTGKVAALTIAQNGPEPTPPTTYSVSKLASFDLVPTRSIYSGIAETLTFCLTHRERLAVLPV